MCTKGQILHALLREDEVGMHAIGRALVHLYNRQTRDEQVQETTQHDNGIGFTGADGRIGVNMAKFYMNRGYLTTKQVAYWRARNRRGISRICKYWRQLKEEAERKELEKRQGRLAVDQNAAERLLVQYESDPNMTWDRYKREFAEIERQQEAQAAMEGMR